MKKKLEDSIQLFLDSDASAMQVAMSKFELEQMGIKSADMPETTGILISLQYIDLDSYGEEEEEKDKHGIKLVENKN